MQKVRAHPRVRLAVAASVVFSSLSVVTLADQEPTVSSTPLKQPTSSVQLYVFDCGVLHVEDVGRFGLKPAEVATSNLSVPAFLVVHPKGTLIWDTGAVPDNAWTASGKEVTYHVVLPGWERYVTMTKSLTQQLAGVGYSPADITYLALSHYHYDHTANANQFANATWLVRREERDAMFAPKAPPVTQPSTYSALRHSKTVIIKTDDYDVFGDGAVIIKSAPGHTPGHQMLYLNIAHTGPVLLAGDLYHYPEERALDRVPTFEFDAKRTRASRIVTEAFLKRSGAQLWIQHDFRANAKLRKAPEYYD